MQLQARLVDTKYFLVLSRLRMQIAGHLAEYVLGLLVFRFPFGDTSIYCELSDWIELPPLP